MHVISIQPRCLATGARPCRRQVLARWFFEKVSGINDPAWVSVCFFGDIREPVAAQGSDGVRLFDGVVRVCAGVLEEAKSPTAPLAVGDREARSSGSRRSADGCLCGLGARLPIGSGAERAGTRSFCNREQLAALSQHECPKMRQARAMRQSCLSISL